MTPVLLLDRSTSLITAPPEDATRREFITGVGAAALAAAFLAACGEDPADDRTATPTGTPEATTRVVDHAFGTIEVPVDPQRVIVADNNALPYILELGVVPIAAGSLGPEVFDGRDFHPALYELGAEETVPFSRDEPDYELVASLAPDLIIGSTFSLLNRVAGGVETYEQMAPLAAVDSDLPVFEQIRGYARILGREERAEALIAEFEDSIRSLAADVSVTDISIARAFGESDVFIYTEAEPFTALWLDLLGVTVVPGTENASEAGTIIASAEQLSELQGEALIVIDGIDRLEGNPLWPLLPAVQAGKVHSVGDYLTYNGGGGLNALREQIVGIAEFLATVE
ncbi:MAG: ABC transporter substrate-binding protein [Dehalococcoidia bacterium]|nr:ABC transporter substrate-binding protein [Dehalococcoidia bacterium]